jgi:murein L,D-transpeptidase YafK
VSLVGQMRKYALAAITLGLLIGSGIIAFQQRAQRTVVTSKDQTGSRLVQDRVAAGPLKLPVKNPRIIVRKSARKLELYSDSVLLKTYKVGLGLNPVADKKQEGDRCTPEGEFYIFTKNSKSAYYLSLGLSYPNAEDADRGLRDGLITKAEYGAIHAAIRKKTMPLQNTKLGGQIYIHGHGAGSDWTWGCVALENEDVKEIYDAVSAGTPVSIVP